jgi:hypothetical protein
MHRKTQTPRMQTKPTGINAANAAYGFDVSSVDDAAVVVS